MVNKSYIRTPKPGEQIKVEPSIAMVKDLLEEDMDGHVIYFCEEAARIAKPGKKDKHRPVVGMPVISVKIGDHCYHGLSDMGASVSAIPYTLYQEIMKDIAPADKVVRIAILLYDSTTLRSELTPMILRF